MGMSIHGHVGEMGVSWALDLVQVLTDTCFSFFFFLLHRFYGWLHEYQRAIFSFYLSYYVVLIDIDWMMHTYITVIKPERIMDLTSPLL